MNYFFRAGCLIRKQCKKNASTNNYDPFIYSPFTLRILMHKDTRYFEEKSFNSIYNAVTALFSWT